MHASIAVAALLAFIAWQLVDRAMLASRGSIAHSADDRGSARLMLATNPTSWAAATVVAFLGFTPMPHVGGVVVGAGCVLLGLGAALRIAAIRLLGRFHTPEVAVAPDQTLCTSGLYRFVRHPSYLGMLIGLVGLGLAMGSWLALGLFVLPTAASYAYRIHVEEALLERRFGEVFRDYARRSWRLIPLVY